VTRISGWIKQSRKSSRSAPKRKSSASAALALAATGLAIGLTLSATPPAVAAAADIDTNPTPALQDPQLDVTGGGGTFPPLGGSPDDPSLTQPPPYVDPHASLRLRDLSDGDSPMAPLPPAIVAGPIGIALAGWMAHRANRRGGRI
jgi:hypothetical protein